MLVDKVRLFITLSQRKMQKNKVRHLKSDKNVGKSEIYYIFVFFWITVFLTVPNDFS